MRVTEIRVKRHHDKGGHENNKRRNGSDEKRNGQKVTKVSEKDRKVIVHRRNGKSKILG